MRLVYILFIIALIFIYFINSDKRANLIDMNYHIIVFFIISYSITMQYQICHEILLKHDSRYAELSRRES